MMPRLASRLVFAVVCAVGLPLTAQASDLDDARGSTLEVRFGIYRPSIDDQFDLADGQSGPYAQAFGAGREVMFLLAWEKHLYNDFGALSFGFGAGYWSVSGQAQPADSNVIVDTRGTTEFQMLPIYSQLTYRFDAFADVVPLAPALRLGVDYYLWRVLDSEGEVAQFKPGKDAMGGTYGWHAAIGVHLLLDFFAEEMATDFAREAGVYNSYLTAEYQYSQIDDFASADSFRLGDETVIIGLALDL